MSRTSSGYRPEIDGLRAIAVLCVLAFHVGLPGFSGGFVGVDVFFVISGYLITGIIADEIAATGRLDFKKFYVRRIRRVMPALFVVLALTWLAAWALLSLPHFDSFNDSFLAAIFSVSNIHYFLSADYFDAVSEVKPLLHTWSLGVEMQFYLVWPLLLVLVLRPGRPRALLWLCLAVGLLTLAANVMLLDWVPQHYQVDNAAAAAFYLTPLRMYEFAIGGGLVWLQTYPLRGRWLAEILLASGLGLIALSALVFTEGTPFPSYFVLVPCTGAALIIYAEGARFGRAVLSAFPVRYFGEISYSLYLCHWPVVVFYRYVQHYYLARPPAPSDAVFMIALTVALAIPLFHFIEKPFRLKSRAKAPDTLPRKGGAWFGSLSTTVAVGLALAALGVASDVNAGWPSRTSVSSEMLAAYRNTGFGNFRRANYGGVDCQPSCVTKQGAKIGQRTWVLGDSHATALAAGLEQLGSRSYELVDNPCAFYSMEYCPQAQVTAGRLANRDAVFAQVASTSDPVVLASFWPAWAHPQTSVDGTRTVAFASTREIANFQVEQLKRLKTRLANNALTVIGALPTFGGLSAAECLTLPTLFARGRTGQIQCGRRPPSAQIRDLNAAIAAGLEGTGIAFIDPFPYFCDANSCSSIIDGRILFADSNHLSIDGSVYFVRQILDRLEPE
jgi:peptidoglycan/LPS O-acetylase OafA/YrhL